MARQFRTPRMEKNWNGLPSGTLNMAAEGTFLAPGFLSFLANSTILRVRGEFTIGPDTNGTIASDDKCKIACGLGIFSTDAVNAGGGSMPDPNAEPEFQWLWYLSAAMTFGGTFTQEQLTEGGSFKRVTIDSRSMRKVRPGQSLAFVFQYVDVSGTPPIDINLGVLRVLVGQ